MTNIATRIARRNFASKRGAWKLVAGIAAVSVMTLVSLTSHFGGDAAANDNPSAASEQPVQLAGRWTGKRYGFGMRRGDSTCAGGTDCKITYDIVACEDGWCGIRVADDKSCGGVGLRMKADAAAENAGRLAGKLELASGTAPYVVEAWYHAADADSKPRLSFVGDTGTELLMMRRSFPFEATLERVADASCKLEKATS